MPRMTPAVSALARQTMTAAFEELERTISPADACELRSRTDFEQVRAAALDIEKQLAARQALRNMRRLEPLLKGLEHYGKAVDVLCNGTPFLSWLWSPISLILRVASEYVEAFEQLIKAYARIAATLSRFELLRTTFTDADFQHSLAIFYANILQFHKHAYQFVRKSGWRLLFLTSWGRFQRRFENIFEDLERHGDFIDRVANAKNIAEARELRQEITTWKEKSLAQIQQSEEDHAAMQYREVLSWLKINTSEQFSIFRSALEESSKFPGTCAWVTNHERISCWLQRQPTGSHLWLQGNPGSGKSVLSTQIINFLQKSNSFVMSHSCNQTFASSTKYEAVLKSLLHQLLHKSSDLLAYLYKELVIDKKMPTTSNLEHLIEILLNALSDAGRVEYVWVVVDGIEDCEATKHSRLINLLGRIAKPGMHGKTVCKVLVTSRIHPIKYRRIWQKQTVSLSDETDHLYKAIKLYSSQRLRLLHDRFQQLELDSEDLEEIEETIAKKADGMFLFARLILDYLETNIFFNGDELKHSIERLPKTIAEFYSSIIAQMLSRFDARSVDRVRCTLSWIAYAKRPLKRQELLSALAFSTGAANITSAAPRYMLELCSPLVEERRDSTLTFIHVSVKEFLQSSSCAVSINERDALREHGLATIACVLTGLDVFNSNYQDQTRLLRLVKGVYALHVYSTEYWTEYLLENALLGRGLGSFPRLLDVASRLAEKLAAMTPAAQSPSELADVIANHRIQLLDEYPDIKMQVEKALRGRSSDQLASDIFDPKRTSTTCAPDGVSAALGIYQKAVEYVLDQDQCPGASTEELEQFKTHFRSSAYTCRLRSCPRATVGFENEKARHEHEIGHAGGFRCSVPNCRYPPVRTSSLLEQHMQRYHAVQSARRSIRRVARKPLNSETTLNGPRTTGREETQHNLLSRVDDRPRPSTPVRYIANDQSSALVQETKSLDESPSYFRSESSHPGRLDEKPVDFRFPRFECLVPARLDLAFFTKTLLEFPRDYNRLIHAIRVWALEPPGSQHNSRNPKALSRVVHQVLISASHEVTKPYKDFLDAGGLSVIVQLDEQFSLVMSLSRRLYNPQSDDVRLCSVCDRRETTTADPLVECSYTHCWERYHKGCHTFVPSQFGVFCNETCRFRKTRSIGPKKNGPELSDGKRRPILDSDTEIATNTNNGAENRFKSINSPVQPDDTIRATETNSLEPATQQAFVQGVNLINPTSRNLPDVLWIVRFLSLTPPRRQFPTLAQLHDLLSPQGTSFTSYFKGVSSLIMRDDARLLAHVTSLISRVVNELHAPNSPPELYLFRDTNLSRIYSRLNTLREDGVEGPRESSISKSVGYLETSILQKYDMYLLRQAQTSLANSPKWNESFTSRQDSKPLENRSIDYRGELISLPAPNSTFTDQNINLGRLPAPSSEDSPLFNTGSGLFYAIRCRDQEFPCPPNYPSLREIYESISPGAQSVSKLASKFLHRMEENWEHLLRCVAILCFRFGSGLLARRDPLPTLETMQKYLHERCFSPEDIARQLSKGNLVGEQWGPLSVMDNPKALADALGFETMPYPDFPTLRDIRTLIPPTGENLDEMVMKHHSVLGSTQKLRFALGIVSVQKEGKIFRDNVLKEESLTRWVANWSGKWQIQRERVKWKIQRERLKRTSSILGSGPSEQEAKKARPNSAHNPKPTGSYFSCSVVGCNYSFVSYEQLEEHRKIHEKQESRRLEASQRFGSAANEMLREWRQDQNYR